MGKTKIVMILPALSPGGLERVMIELAWYFSKVQNIEVTLISLTKGNSFYKIPDNINFYEPLFKHRKYNRIVFTIKIFSFLRKKLKELKPNILLSFGGKYNSFVLLASSGLKIKTYISDRSRPSISYGKFLDMLNPIMYKRATGIVAQTKHAKKAIFKKTKHRNIKVIGNPIRVIDSELLKENIVLNVGRFIKSKHQDLLIEYFAEINLPNWRLIFLGDGPYWEDAKEKAKKLKIIDKVEFLGVIKNIDEYYSKSKIFAFTSTSEGFPNALGEAMSAGCACISYNCEAGPSDLIDNGNNGFLVDEMEHTEYKEKLQILMNDEKLRARLGKAARTRIEENFSIEKIGKQYLDFLLKK